MNLSSQEIINDLISFIDYGKTPHHVVERVADTLATANFKILKEGEPWKLSNGEGYYFVKGGSIIAFYYSTKNLPYKIWGAHTDSPAIKLRGLSEQNYQSRDHKDKQNYQVWGVEVYGSPILNTWLDRPLDISGRVFVNTLSSNEPECRLWKSKQAQAVIANAAIHLNREVNKNFSLNRETQLQALVSSEYEGGLKAEVAASLNIKETDILALDFFLNDFQPPTLLGGLIQSPKLDNLAMCHAGLNALLTYSQLNQKLNNGGINFPVLALFNNEEVGSRSSEGAGSNLLGRVLERINYSLGYNLEEVAIVQAKSAIISADMGHAYHPGFDELYGKEFRSYLDGGVVLKRDSNLHYINDTDLLVKAKKILQDNTLDYQEYFQHNNIPCGTTIGPYLSSTMGMKTLDLGTAILAMHSLRETGSIKDHETITRFAELFLTEK